MYNPSDVGKKGSLFGLPYTVDQASLVIVPVNLDVTVSYNEGTSSAPARILDESTQLDLSIPGVAAPWKLKVAIDSPVLWVAKNATSRQSAKSIIDSLENGKEIAPEHLFQVNNYCAEVHERVEQVCMTHLERGKLVAILGGDHSAPLGLIRTLSSHHDFGILQIDAHMDLRSAYEGFEFSHASIMHNALKCDGVKSLTQVGIRDYCEEEELLCEKSSKTIHTFFDEVMFNEREQGHSWSRQVIAIVATLPQKVYISFDVDGLDPSLCPHTGTPVPGGMTFNEVVYLLKEIVASGRSIIGFDLCEVGDDRWDANVGARVLYRLCLALGQSQKLI